MGAGLGTGTREGGMLSSTFNGGGFWEMTGYPFQAFSHFFFLSDDTGKGHDRQAHRSSVGYLM